MSQHKMISRKTALIAFSTQPCNNKCFGLAPMKPWENALKSFGERITAPHMGLCLLFFMVAKSKQLGIVFLLERQSLLAEVPCAGEISVDDRLAPVKRIGLLVYEATAI